MDFRCKNKFQLCIFEEIKRDYQKKIKNEEKICGYSFENI